MNLTLTSDFPSTPNRAVVSRIQAAARSPRVAWVAPVTTTGRARFPEAQAAFGSFGVAHLEYVDIDEAPNMAHLALLDRYDVVYLTGGDPVVFRQNIRRIGFDGRLREFVAAGRLIVGASGGAMQLTRNVSLFRLLSSTVEDVVARRTAFDGLDLVGYELLPHLNRHDASFLEKVRRYSSLVPHDVVAIDDGAAVVSTDRDECRRLGEAVRFHQGTRGSIEPAE